MDDVRDRLRNASELVTPLERPFDRMVERRDRKQRSQRLASAAAAFAIAAGVVGGGVILLSRLGQAQVDVADGARWQSTKELALLPGDYFYLRIESSEEEDGHVRDEETWWGLDGSGEVRNRSTRQDKYPYPPSGIYARGEFPTDVVDLSELSTDASVLADQLRHEPWNRWLGQPPSPDALWIFTRVLLLETPPAPPELRAAVFEMASGIDGVIVSRNDLDPVGRAAIGLRVSEAENGATWMMYFDPGTHQALAWTFRSDRGGESWQILESGIVGSSGAQPEGEEWLVPPLPN
jgi:hypothetical protein